MMDVLYVAGLFVVRIGLPLLVLMVIGTLVEHAYNRREKSA
jgi:hypothetical protein